MDGNIPFLFEYCANLVFHLHGVVVHSVPQIQHQNDSVFNLGCTDPYWAPKIFYTKGQRYHLYFPHFLPLINYSFIINIIIISL